MENNHIKTDNENGISYLKMAVKAAVSRVKNGDEEKIFLEGICSITVTEALKDMGYEEPDDIKVCGGPKGHIFLTFFIDGIVILIDTVSGATAVTTKRYYDLHG